MSRMKLLWSLVAHGKVPGHEEAERRVRDVENRLAVIEGLDCIKRLIRQENSE